MWKQCDNHNSFGYLLISKYLCIQIYTSFTETRNILFITAELYHSPSNCERNMSNDLTFNGIRLQITNTITVCRSVTSCVSALYKPYRNRITFVSYRITVYIGSKPLIISLLRHKNPQSDIKNTQKSPKSHFSPYYTHVYNKVHV